GRIALRRLDAHGFGGKELRYDGEVACRLRLARGQKDQAGERNEEKTWRRRCDEEASLHQQRVKAPAHRLNEFIAATAFCFDFSQSPYIRAVPDVNVLLAEIPHAEIGRHYAFTFVRHCDMPFARGLAGDRAGSAEEALAGGSGTAPHHAERSVSAKP